ncbi:MAG TPA: M36 family metallopeptidase, partial [Blastocatellia bacterium]|nr:M36 family metallopeptidase [Blastocatellia bacterium]
ATDERAGFTRLALEQRANGIRVFGRDMLFIIDREGRLVSESGSFVPEIERLALERAPSLGAVEAFYRAAAECGAELKAGVSAVEDRLAGRERVVFASSEVDGRSEASLVYYPLTESDVRLAYQVLYYGASAGFDSYLVIIDARTGRLLRRDSLTFAASARVFTKENPVASAGREVVSLDGDPVASPLGWASGGRTEGNNTRVSYNPFADQNGGEVVEAASDGSFDFPLDLAAGSSPVDYFKASAANLFYWVNVAHDRFHALGFDEPSRNFQADNFDRGGRGGDLIHAETLRGAKIDPDRGGLIRNNAFFATTLDGTPPLLAMLLWEFDLDGRRVELDSSYDAGVIIHEFTHGVSTRLTGTDNSIGLSGSIQGRGMGEGWSDFFALSFLSGGDRAQDDCFSIGSYVTQRARGVRAYPYTTRLDRDPLTFGDIQANSQVHAQGTVWCSMLWDMRQALVERYRFERGREIAERLVIDGLKLTPIAPLFTDARDAILLADRITNAGANQEIIWRAFARRGLGAKAATSPELQQMGFRIAASESFEVPAEVTSGLLVIDDRPPAVAELFETIPVTVLDRDLASQPEVAARAVNSRTGASAAFTLARSEPGRFTGGLRVLPPEADQGGEARIVAEPGDEILIVYENARGGSGGAEALEARLVAGRRVTVYEMSFEQGAPGWALQKLWHLTRRRAASPDFSLYFAKKKGKKEKKSFTPKHSSGSALSPEIDTGGMLKPRLEFDYLFIGTAAGSEFDPEGDRVGVLASNLAFIEPAGAFGDEPGLLITFQLRPHSEVLFRRATVDLHYIEARPAYLNFTFEASSADLKRKKLEGFYLDNVRLTAISTR